MSTDPFLTMTTDSDLAACASSSDHEIRYQRALREYRTARVEHRKWQDAEEVQRARNVKLVRRLRHDIEEAEHIHKAKAVQAQRDKWKAASTRYYLKHPKIKEKKARQNGGKKVAHKLARRRWDPPKAAQKPDGEGQLGDFSGMPDLDLDVEDGGPVRLTHDEALRDLLGISKDSHDTADTVAAASLLFVRTHRPPQRQSSGASGDAWSSLAPDYPSS
ncbi:hypothetical protein B0H14DRAFT_3532065 [Mycena olivaceomarginata]|nr:hypothetical protein B0H14DRAFT_3532065 [Mycena olivaceomarginata]